MAAATQKIVILADDKTGAAIASAIRNSQKLDNQLRKTGDTMRNTTRQSRAHMAQLGHQVQDVAVQLQMGMNPLMVFAQQGSQIASIFGVGGAMLGGLIAVAAVIAQQLVPSLFDANEGFEKFNEKTKELSDNLEKDSPRLFARGIRLAQEEVDKAREAFEEQNQSIIDMQKSLAILESNFERTGQLAYARQIDKLKQSIEDARDVSEEKRLELEKAIATLESYSQGSEEAAESVKKVTANTKALSKALAVLAPFIKQTTTPIETFNKQMKALETLFGAGEIELEKYLQMQKLIHDQFVDNVEAGFELGNQVEQTTKKVSEATTVARQYGLTLQDVEKNAVGSLEDGLVGLINGTKSASSAFKDMARSIINDMIRMQVQQSITGPLMNMISAGGLNIGTAMRYGTNVGSQQTSMLAAQNAGLRAMGGPVSANKPYIVGERGPELMIPRGGGTVVPNSQMGAEAPVNVTLNISTGVAQTVRTEIASLMPQITNATKAAVVEARRRGGSFANAFGA